MQKLKRITRSYIWVTSVRSPTPILEYFLNYYGINYYIKDIPYINVVQPKIPNGIWLDALTKENKRILPFILHICGAQYQTNATYYWQKQWGK